MQEKKRPLWAIVLCAALAGCGGGESEPVWEPSNSTLLALQALRTAAQPAAAIENQPGKGASNSSFPAAVSPTLPLSGFSFSSSFSDSLSFEATALPPGQHQLHASSTQATPRAKWG